MGLLSKFKRRKKQDGDTDQQDTGELLENAISKKLDELIKELKLDAELKPLHDPSGYNEIRGTLLSRSFQVNASRQLPDKILTTSSVVSDRQKVEDSIRAFTALKIKKELHETVEIPPLSDSTKQLISLRSNPYAKVGDLVDIVESDQSFAAMVLKLANSSAYMGSGSIHSVFDAVQRVLGFDLVMNLLLGRAAERGLMRGVFGF